MSSWKEDNYIKRFSEAEEPFNYLNELKKLINGELVASMQYEIAAKGIVGANNLSYLQGHFTEHAGEEKAHYEALVDALMQRGVDPEMNLVETVQNALPETEELNAFDCDYLKDFFARAEANAIEAYQNFYDKIEAEDKDLADIINGIISDERGHLLDMQKLDGKLGEVEVSEEPEEVEEQIEEVVEEPKKDLITEE